MPTTLRITAKLAFGTLMCLTLAACGAAADDATDDQPEWATIAPNEASGAISVWAWSSDQETVDEIADRFMAEYPDIDVTFKYTAYQDYTRLLSAALASGEGPDAFVIEPQSLQQFAPLVEDLTPVFESQLGDGWRDQMSEGAVAELTADDARVVGAPLQLNGNGMMLINQGLLDELGLEWPDDIRSIDELVAFCDKVRSAGKGCIGIGQDEWVHQDVFQAIANSIEPGLFTSAVRGETPWTDPGLIEAFDIFQRLYLDEVTPEGALAMPMYPDVDNEFQRGNLIALAAGNWSAMNLLAENSTGFQTGAGVTDPEPLKVRLVPWPAVGGQDVHVFASVYGGMAISESSGNKAAAAAWVHWYALDPTGQQLEAANQLIGIPAVAGVEINPEGLAYPELGEESIAYLSDEFANSDDPRNIPYPDLITALETAWQQSATGSDSESVAEELEAASSAIDR